MLIVTTVFQKIVSHVTTIVYSGWQWRNFFIPYSVPADFPPWCAASSEKCLSLWRHFLSKVVIIRTFFLNQLIRVYSNSATNLPLPHNFVQYAVLPHSVEIVMWPQITVTSLHPMYRKLRLCSCLLLFSAYMAPISNKFVTRLVDKVTIQVMN